jgi:hypothetical protein
VKINIRAIAESYGRSWLVAIFSIYTVNPDASAKDLLLGSLIAVLAPVLRAANPDDKAFGIGSKD